MLSESPGFELLALYGKFPLAIYFTHGNVYVSVLRLGLWIFRTGRYQTQKIV